ncbi:MAG: hypothetical protein U0802_15470 [Candidatus Binatia bacterium]
MASGAPEIAIHQRDQRRRVADHEGDAAEVADLVAALAAAVGQAERLEHEHAAGAEAGQVEGEQPGASVVPLARLLYVPSASFSFRFTLVGERGVAAAGDDADRHASRPRSGTAPAP